MQYLTFYEIWRAFSKERYNKRKGMVMNMKKNRKKTISVIMAFLLALQASGTVFADDTDTDSTGTGTGQVNVSISPALALERNVDFTAALTGTDGRTLTKSLALGSDDESDELRFS